MRGLPIMAPLSGDAIDGRFVVGSRAGEGGMGAVYRAVDLSTQRPVALKVLLTAHREQQGSRFEREAHVLSELSHPRIVRYVAHGVTPRGALYLAMEWLDGEDLGRRLRREGLTAEETVRLASHAAEALAYAHSRGVVHRDIKPSNLFLVGGELDGLRIIDFGVASAATGMSITRTGTGLGTPGYMSPEQVRGARDVTAAADVFSLGSVLYECLAARPAFVGDNVLALLAQLLYENVPRVSKIVAGIAPPLEDLVHRMLEKAPAMRPADGTAVLASLRAIAMGATELGPRARVTLGRPKARPRWTAEVTCPKCYWTGPQELSAGAHGHIPVACAKCGHAFELDATVGCEIDRDLDLASIDEPHALSADTVAARPIADPDRSRDPHAEIDLAPDGPLPDLELVDEQRPTRDHAHAPSPPPPPSDPAAPSNVASPRDERTMRERARLPASRSAGARVSSRTPRTLVPAGVGRRAVAAVIDALLVYGVQGALWRWWLTNARGRLIVANATSEEHAQLGWIALGVALALAMISTSYFVVPTAVWGQTLGKRLFGITVVDESGESPSMGRAALREVVGRWVSWLCCGFGFALALFDPERRTLHDRIAGTRVVDAD